MVVSHRGQEVEVELDSSGQRMQAREGHQHLHMDPAVYFGGIQASHSGLGRENSAAVSANKILANAHSLADEIHATLTG